jgi:hypothetical protein
VTESVDDRLKKSTVGLVSLSDFQKTKDDIEEQQRQTAAKTAKRFVVLSDLLLRYQCVGQGAQGETKGEDEALI